MADIELVIKIPEGAYQLLKNEGVDWLGAEHILNAVANGTPLPKGHGRLIDADAFKQNICTYQQTGCGSCKHSLCCPEDVLTIIEADKEESEDKE